MVLTRAEIAERCGVADADVRAVYEFSDRVCAVTHDGVKHWGALVVVASPAATPLDDLDAGDDEQPPEGTGGSEGEDPPGEDKAPEDEQPPEEPETAEGDTEQDAPAPKPRTSRRR